MLKHKIKEIYDSGLLYEIIDLYNNGLLYKFTNDENFKINTFDSNTDIKTSELSDNYQLHELSDIDKIHFYDCVLHNLYEFVQHNPTIYCGKNWKESLIDRIEEICEEYEDYGNLDFVNNEEILNLFYHIVPQRSRINNDVLFTVNKSNIKTKLDIINEKDKIQPEQRTQEWFQKRYNLISASTAWKSIDSQAAKNSIIVDKCKPLDTEKYNYVNMNSPMHWGQKYEPISQMYYEYTYKTVVREYGCIPHSKYNFLGASPDGIVINPESTRYGRMLEIKNIVNRDITGIPKKEYWVQTQMQMECCDLDECDFLECRIKEYDNEDEFMADGNDIYKTNNGKSKGIILLFFLNNKPFYEYFPFDGSINNFDLWFDNKINENKDKLFSNKIFWRMDEVSCVLIERNKLWFDSIVQDMSDIWNIILKERETGYEHRLPTKRKNTKVKKDINTISLLIKEDDDDDKPKKICKTDYMSLLIKDDDSIVEKESISLLIKDDEKKSISVLIKEPEDDKKKTSDRLIINVIT